ncbi:hypothetical protein [Paenibacillus hunanensis]|uniref:Uncharacterized protein n=1 Tax=Paenibacillus hunanensis TaxID=539262 RepID=A0ABU1J486_9BACL|nr:hypothetical protein [Paenibacillus hunanensis]MDR6246328.1 hypothetical protein [Paenibacillus hunanensis]GGJ30602.1 hypothetical protein GCM10008022_44240 [Paenibacillus hunanensis]
MKTKILISSTIAALLATSAVLPNVPIAQAQNLMNEESLDKMDSQELFNYVYSNSQAKTEQIKTDDGETLTSINLEMDSDDIKSSNLSQDNKRMLENSLAPSIDGEEKALKSKTIVSVLTAQDEVTVEQNRKELLSNTSSSLASAAATGGGSVYDQASKEGYGTVVGTLNYVSTTKQNVDYFGIKSISGKFFPIGDTIIVSRTMIAGQVGPGVNKVQYYYPSQNSKTTYTLNWTSDSMLAPRGASVVGMNIKMDVKKGANGKVFTVQKPVNIINY